MRAKVVLAVGAHPDDIEFMMAGTLLLLKQAGWETHYLNVANGSCGSAAHPAAKVRAVRRWEGRASAKILGAIYHESLVDDLEIFFERSTLRRLAAIVRSIEPGVVLAPSPQDYMEDHTNTCRLVVTATFVRGMRNFRTIPSSKPVDGEAVVYHAMPHGLRDPLRQRVLPSAFVNTAGVHAQKMSALAQHRSQQNWLDESQGMNDYLLTMDGFSREMGRMSGRFAHAEGWRRRLHFGFCSPGAEPLRDALGPDYLVNSDYESLIESPRPV